MIHRTLLAGLTGLVMLTSVSAMADQANDEKAKKMASNAGCFTCHTLKHLDAKDGSKPVGPAWEDVAVQYKGKPGAAEFLTRIVLEGSNPYASHWKNKAAGIAMPPNAVAISEGDARQLVFWILSH
ncbi:c-type cytochrome [Rhodoferax ferrireducens]|uniref:c-type cytochrome n=1 Tax=Rhodoferax ferrireducens TaxID=192843 RepID=UPI000E0D6914|nr:c-type cytochrome [Rhodoferax ferrireducens]